MTLSPQRLAEAVAVRPSPRQLAWQRTEFYGFLHVGMNTVTDREWGAGHEDPALFDPPALDAGQWVGALRSAGMRGVILTAKHHDGFCLWPSSQTSHSVASSPWRGGGGDLVAEVSAACADQGLRFGLYLSPWDRTEATYGTGAAYDDFFVRQLEELLTGYGPLFSVWFDGACGEGPDGRRQVYDWDRYFEVVRRLQPDACLSVCGPDVRWCGNEAGHTRADEWSVVPASLRDAERTASLSQQSDDPAFRTRARSDDDDLGSREALSRSDEPFVWYPAEVNTSIRPGWFHHPAEDDQVRPAEELFEIYRRSVGGNATFLLNVPPAADGLVAAPDVEVLARLGELVRGLRERDLTRAAAIEASSGSAATSDLADLDGAGCWRPAQDDPEPTLTLRWDRPVLVEHVLLREAFEHGQLVEDVVVEGVRADGAVQDLGRARSVGYQRVLDVEADAVVAVVVRIRQARGQVALQGLSVVGSVSPA